MTILAALGLIVGVFFIGYGLGNRGARKDLEAALAAEEESENV